MKKASKSKKGREKAPSAEVLLRALLGIWQSGDTTDLKTILHKDIVYEDVPNDHAFSGLDEVAGYIDHVHSWASDLRIEVRSIETSSKMAVAEWTMIARQGQPMGSRVRVATNRKIRLRGVTLVRASRGRITKATDYHDALSLMRQLGGRVDLPGGGTMDPLRVE
ncbi:MAG: hypothetical protein DRP71_04355 [Verrucomicrobia bacterium]|nr:MAG: hypothetical protein DRP71_04355 [Verrucomicrobiota bacterium]